jgi:hypothetical protein
LSGPADWSPIDDSVAVVIVVVVLLLLLLLLLLLAFDIILNTNTKYVKDRIYRGNYTTSN